MSAELLNLSTQFEVASKQNKTDSGEFCQICNEVERFQAKSKHKKEKIDSLLKVLQNIQVFEITELWSRGPPVTIRASQTIQYALFLINKWKVYSLPVLNQQDQMIGLIDVLDIVKQLILNCFKGKSYEEAKTKEFLETHVDALFLLQLDKDRSKSYSIARDTPALLAIQNMANLRRDRFVIVDRKVAGFVEELPYPEVFFQGILSTSDILRFFCKYPTWIQKEPFFKKPIKELFTVFRSPLVVNMKEITHNVISDLDNTGRKGTAVVDDDGKLMWNFSPSDLKGITLANCHLLNCPLQEFLEQDRSRDWWTAPISVDLNSSLYELMQQFVCTRVHRMYVVDDDGKPTGEINQRDILKQILNFARF